MAQNSIIELQVINYAIKHKDLDFLRKENISAGQFSDVYRSFIDYIFKHYDKYGVVPDEATMLSTFGEDYTVIDVQESPKYLVDKLKSFLAFVKFSRDFAVARQQIEEGNMESALPFLKQSADEALSIFGTSGVGVDIVTDTSRVDEYEKRLSGDGEKTYSLGIPSLDEAFGGLLRDDLMLLFARLGHGKSYMMTYIAHALHQQGLNVLFYSGEMEANQVGYRYDSIDSGFSNKALLFGKPLQNGKSYPQYKAYVGSLGNRQNYFKVVVPADFGGRFINMNDIHKLVDDLKPDVIFIDQLSLVEDVRSTKVTQDRVKYGNIMADLRVLSNTKRIPIIVAAQANRVSATKNEEGEFDVPEMAHIAESDAIGHHATRAIAFCTNRVDETEKRVMKVAVRKNRHGGHTEFKMDVDFEHGVFEELRQKRLRDDGQPSAASAF